jgi:glutathione-independent formaldehyde dehydrogenase
MSSTRAVANRETSEVEAIGCDRVRIAKAVNATALPLGDAPKGHATFGAGAAAAYVLSPNDYIQ